MARCTARAWPLQMRTYNPETLATGAGGPLGTLEAAPLSQLLVRVTD